MQKNKNELNMQKVKDSEVIFKGFSFVNLPTLVIMFGGIFLLFCTTDWSFNRCVLLGAALGWIYWEFAVVKWIKWALRMEVDKAKLFKLGQRSFVLWNSSKIDKVASKLDK
jgi:hypothetical protein